MLHWINKQYPKHKNGDPDRRAVNDLTIGDLNWIGDSKTLHMRNYNPATKIFTFANRNLDLGTLKAELMELQEFFRLSIRTSSTGWVVEMV